MLTPRPRSSVGCSQLRIGVLPAASSRGSRRTSSSTSWHKQSQSRCCSSTAPGPVSTVGVPNKNNLDHVRELFLTRSWRRLQTELQQGLDTDMGLADVCDVLHMFANGGILDEAATSSSCSRSSKGKDTSEQDKARRSACLGFVADTVLPSLLAGAHFLPSDRIARLAKDCCLLTDLFQSVSQAQVEGEGDRDATAGFGSLNFDSLLGTIAERWNTPGEIASHEVGDLLLSTQRLLAVTTKQAGGIADGGGRSSCSSSRAAAFFEQNLRLNALRWLESGEPDPTQACKLIFCVYKEFGLGGAATPIAGPGRDLAQSANSSEWIRTRIVEPVLLSKAADSCKSSCKPPSAPAAHDGAVASAPNPKQLQVPLRHYARALYALASSPLPRGCPAFSGHATRTPSPSGREKNSFSFSADDLTFICDMQLLGRSPEEWAATRPKDLCRLLKWVAKMRGRSRSSRSSFYNNQQDEVEDRLQRVGEKALLELQRQAANVTKLDTLSALHFLASSSNTSTQLVDWLLHELKRSLHEVTPLQHYQLLQDLNRLRFASSDRPDSSQIYVDLLHFFVRDQELFTEHTVKVPKCSLFTLCLHQYAKLGMLQKVSKLYKITTVFLANNQLALHPADVSLCAYSLAKGNKFPGWYLYGVIPALTKHTLRKDYGLEDIAQLLHAYAGNWKLVGTKNQLFGNGTKIATANAKAAGRGAASEDLAIADLGGGDDHDLAGLEDEAVFAFGKAATSTGGTTSTTTGPEEGEDEEADRAAQSWLARRATRSSSSSCSLRSNASPLRAAAYHGKSHAEFAKLPKQLRGKRPFVLLANKCKGGEKATKVRQEIRRLQWISKHRPETLSQHRLATALKAIKSRSSAGKGKAKGRNDHSAKASSSDPRARKQRDENLATHREMVSQLAAEVEKKLKPQMSSASQNGADRLHPIEPRKETLLSCVFSLCRLRVQNTALLLALFRKLTVGSGSSSKFKLTVRERVFALFLYGACGLARETNIQLVGDKNLLADAGHAVGGGGERGAILRSLSLASGNIRDPRTRSTSASPSRFCLRQASLLCSSAALGVPLDGSVKQALRDRIAHAVETTETESARRKSSVAGMQLRGGPGLPWLPQEWFLDLSRLFFSAPPALGEILTPEDRLALFTVFVENLSGRLPGASDVPLLAPVAAARQATQAYGLLATEYQCARRSAPGAKLQRNLVELLPLCSISQLLQIAATTRLLRCSDAEDLKIVHPRHHANATQVKLTHRLGSLLKEKLQDVGGFPPTAGSSSSTSRTSVEKSWPEILFELGIWQRLRASDQLRLRKGQRMRVFSENGRSYRSQQEPSENEQAAFDAGLQVDPHSALSLGQGPGVEDHEIHEDHPEHHPLVAPPKRTPKTIAKPPAFRLRPSEYEIDREFERGKHKLHRLGEDDNCFLSMKKQRQRVKVVRKLTEKRREKMFEKCGRGDEFFGSSSRSLQIGQEATLDPVRSAWKEKWRNEFERAGKTEEERLRKSSMESAIEIMRKA